MILLPPDIQRSEYIHRVRFYFEEFTSWVEFDRKISLWAYNQFGNNFACTENCLVWAGINKNKRVIEYGFKKQDDAMMFKLTWK